MRSACEESCFADADCGSSGERCCPNDCGGHSCQSPQKWSGQKQKDLQGQCTKSDVFMQCLYDQLKEKVSTIRPIPSLCTNVCMYLSLLHVDRKLKRRKGWYVHTMLMWVLKKQRPGCYSQCNIPYKCTHIQMCIRRYK
jgi:hypothetical protein